MKPVSGRWLGAIALLSYKLHFMIAVELRMPKEEICQVYNHKDFLRVFSRTRTTLGKTFRCE